VPSKSIPQIWRGLSYWAKFIFLGFIAIVADVAIIFATRDGDYSPAQPAASQGDGGEAWIFMLALFFLYFIPSIAGWRKRNFGAIFILNLLLGWTVIGWIVALVWGWTNDPPSLKTTTEQSAPARSIPPMLCIHCGKYSLPASSFCTSCGNTLAR
jgi:hypothetical protein